MAGTEDNLNEMLILKREKLNKLVDEGKNPFLIEKYDCSHYSSDIINNFEEFVDNKVSVAGRLMSKRGHGKVMFVDLQDSEGKIQLFVKKELLQVRVY